MFLFKMQHENFKRLRGKAAIEHAHREILSEDEIKLDLLISDMYLVGSEEATEIHASYHRERILLAMERRAAKNNMVMDSILQKIEYSYLSEVALLVARGKLTEAGAVDLLFRRFRASEDGFRDRYVNFYG